MKVGIILASLNAHLERFITKMRNRKRGFILPKRRRLAKQLDIMYPKVAGIAMRRCGWPAAKLIEEHDEPAAKAIANLGNLAVKNIKEHGKIAAERLSTTDAKKAVDKYEGIAADLIVKYGPSAAKAIINTGARALELIGYYGKPAAVALSRFGKDREIVQPIEIYGAEAAEIISKAKDQNIASRLAKVILKHGTLTVKALERDTENRLAMIETEGDVAIAQILNRPVPKRAALRVVDIEKDIG